MFNDSYHPGADKDSGRFTDGAVTRGGLSGSECMLIAIRKYVASLTISLARRGTLARRMPEGRRRKTKINERR